MPLIKNITKEKLKAGELVLGLGLRQVRTPDIAKVAAVSGYDFLFIDLEHSAMSLETAADISVAALDAGCTPLVRSSSHLHHHASRPLDFGAQGIVVPHVNDEKEARQVADHTLFPPLGHRSVAGAAPQLEYEAVPVDSATKKLNENNLIIVMIESPKAVENADSIAATPGVDGLLIGTNDLCAEMGIAGQYDNKQITTAYDKVISACQNNGKHAAMGGVYSDLAKKFVRMGIKMVLAGSDLSFLMEAAKSRSEFFRKL